MAGTFVRRERKHRRLAKHKSGSASSASFPEAQDANRDVITPEPISAKDARRKQLQAELIAQSTQGKVTGKKRKRLDHYIDTKLKREENAELIRRLASQQVDTSLLQSSKTLGRVTESKRDVLTKALREHNAGIDTSKDQHAVLFQKPRRRSDCLPPSDDEHSEEDSNNEEDVNGHGDGQATLRSVQESTVGFGSGLKRANEHDAGEPAPMKRRKRRKKSFKTEEIRPNKEEKDAPSEWGGFDSADEQSLRADDSDSDGSSVDDEQDSEGVSGDEVEEMVESSGNETDDSDTDTSVSDQRSPRAARFSAFKQWAETQRNDAYGFRPSTAPTLDSSTLATIKPRAPSPDPIAIELQSSANTQNQRQLKAIVIEREAEIQNAREALPVVQEEQRIMEAIGHNPIVIICGATGSGKTTQVPQMMLEGGYGSNCGQQRSDSESQEKTWTKESLGMIGITQPRRVAAVSVAERVKTELGKKNSSRVAHHVRYDTTVSKQTALKFMTDGILLRELHHDFILSKYSAIVIDEAHERSVNTDILIGTLTRIVTLREELTREDPNKYYPLRLIIMSATLRVADFAVNNRLFPQSVPPILEVEGRRFDVTVHFARRTQRDYESEMVKKITRGHRKLPPGTILAFLPGQNEITNVAKQLQQAIGNSAAVRPGPRARITADQQPLENEDMEFPRRTHADEDVNEEEDPDILGLDDDLDDEDAEFNIEVPLDNAGSNQSLSQLTLRAQVLPLYAALSTDQQMQVFKPAPPDTRLIILATNVAETSLTIPGVRFVFDCGRSKEKKYDNDTGISTFEIDWISKASAVQRTGRAGRTGPGHCWRLYSSALYEEHFPEHSTPEILRTPVENVVLQLKAMDIDNVPNFPFPTAPDRQQLRAAEKLLSHLGALQPNGRLTDHGRELMQYPISPRFGKILLLAARNNVVEHAVALVAALAVGDIFLPEVLISQPDEDASRQSYGRAQALLSRWDDQSDAVKMLTAVAVHAEAVAKSSSSGNTKLSQDLFLREKNMTEVQLLRSQLRAILDIQSVHTKSATRSTTLPLATVQQRKMLNQIVAAAFLDQIAVRSDLLPNALRSTGLKPRRAIEVPYIPLFPIDQTQPTEPVFVHSSSVLSRLSKDEMPGYIVYSHLSRAAARTISDESLNARVRMHPLTSISGKALAALAQDTPLLKVGKPVGKIEEFEGGKRRICWVSIALRPSTNEESGSNGIEWPLSAWRVEQVRQRNGEWQIAKVLSR